MPCPHYSIGIVSRGPGGTSHSCTDSASYQSGEKIYSEYEGVWHSGKHVERVVHTDILLPPNAPEEYRDRSVLWNAVDASEKSSVAQTARRIIVALPRELSLEENTALITEHCQEEFVDNGMIADIAVHMEDDGNPHAHVLLTVRAMDKNGKWLPKTKTAYLLDENGERVRDENGKCKRIRMDTVDWNHQDKAELWRHAWEKKQNMYLEKAGSFERVDMRSYKRQGVEKVPQRHMGPAVTAMERKGVETEIGNRNQKISSGNQMLAELHRILEMILSILKALADMIRSIRRGLIVGGFSGGEPGANGEFSGVAKNSFYVEDGEIRGAVLETMISGNLAEVFSHVREISSELISDGNMAFPYLTADGITISGK